MINRLELVQDFFKLSAKNITNSCVFRCYFHIPNTFDHYYYIQFEGNQLRTLAKINGSIAKILCNGQIYKGNLKLTKKEVILFSQFKELVNQMNEKDKMGLL